MAKGESDKSKDLVPTDKKIRSIDDLIEFQKQNPWALYSMKTLRLVLQCLPWVGGSLGELLKDGAPNAEMNLMIKQYQELAGKIDELGIKIDEKLKNPANILLIQNTIEESVNDNAGDKWEFYKNLLLHGLADDEVKSQHINYYKEKIAECSALELIGLANIYKNKANRFLYTAGNPRESYNRVVAIVNESNAFEPILQALKEFFQDIIPEVIDLGSNVLNQKILRELRDKRYIRDTGHGVIHFIIPRKDFSIIINPRKPILPDIIKDSLNVTLAHYCFEPWVLEFTKTIAAEPTKSEG